MSSTAQLSPAEKLNFLLCNRIPRRFCSRFMGWFSKIQNPVIYRISMWVWRLFADDFRLHEARKQTFDSLHDCFTRELKPGSRPLDPDPAVLVSPCDAVVGESGEIDGLSVLQAKGFPYRIDELLGDKADAESLRNGIYVTLRLKSSMYHRFHAPCNAQLSQVRHISGDTWNVNPIALKMVERLFCRNERAVIKLQPDSESGQVTLVAVAAILVSSIKIHGVTERLNRKRHGPQMVQCFRHVVKGEEMGYFEHGSTIIVLAQGPYRLMPHVRTGSLIRMGQALIYSTASRPTTPLPGCWLNKPGEMHHAIIQ